MHQKRPLQRIVVSPWLFHGPQQYRLLSLVRLGALGLKKQANQITETVISTAMIGLEATSLMETFQRMGSDVEPGARKWVKDELGFRYKRRGQK
jgi:hypothetical protein